NNSVSASTLRCCACALSHSSRTARSTTSPAPSWLVNSASNHGTAMTDNPSPAQHVAPASQRESEIIDTLVHLADTLVADYDVIDLLHHLIARCTQLITVAQSRVMLAGPGGQLPPVGASTEQVHLLELFEIQNHDGP